MEPTGGLEPSIASSRLLDRQHAPLDLVSTRFQSEYSKKKLGTSPIPPERRPRPPSTVNNNLRIRLGNQLKKGRYGAIFEAIVLDRSDRRHLPPLIAKVALQLCRGHIARESWFYDELWPLQGVAVPLCFGWFEAEVSPSDDVWRQLGVQSVSPLSPVYPATSKDFYCYNPDHPEEEDYSPAIEGRQVEYASVTTRISILLIERLGVQYLSTPECNRRRGRPHNYAPESTHES